MTLGGGTTQTSNAHTEPAGKRFSVRDGFHLKTRNAEMVAIVDAQLDARGQSPESFDPLPENREQVTSGPTTLEIHSALSTQFPTTDNNNLDGRCQHEAVRETEKCTTSTAVAVLEQLLRVEDANQVPEHTKHCESAAGRSLRAPSEWLIHRHRPSETLQRKQRKVNRLVHEILQKPQPQMTMSAKQDDVRTARRPRCQSTLGSTYSQRVAAARTARQESCGQLYQRTVLQPITETERGLLKSREDNNKAVDKLLMSLFQAPAASSTLSGSASPSAPITKPSKPSTRFATRRSIMRHETAVALRSRNLVSRIDDLRSLPQLLEQMEALRVWKRQQHIEAHGADLVARNRANPTLHMLQKPSQTPLLPSTTDQKLYQANLRKQELDVAQEEKMHRIMTHWQTRKEQRANRARRIHLQSQWLLVVTLAEISEKWLTRFHRFRQRHSALVRSSMAKRVQCFWRKKTMVGPFSLQMLRMAPNSQLSSAFFHMPVVTQAVTKLQQSTRGWLVRKHCHERKEAISLIVTAWFEFQDVKFRRIILRFRKRVRDFQVMWRAWRAITAARIKLLLLVWAKLERKIKRRHGVAVFTMNSSATSDSLMLKVENDTSHGILPTGNGLTPLDMLQRNVAGRPLNQQHMKIEDMHRHFRNGGAVHMPISAVSPGSISNGASPSVGFQSPPSIPGKYHKPRPVENVHVQRDLQLKHHMGEEFQLVMYDVYTTRQNNFKSTSPTHSVHGVALTHDPKRSPNTSRKSPHRGSQQQQLPLQLPPASMIPIPPPTKKVPHQLKMSVLRNLLSEKRKLYSDARDHEREAWAAARKQMRSEAFRYNVLDEMETFQQLQAKYATFLVLHSVTETEMVRLILQTQEQAAAAEQQLHQPQYTHAKQFYA